MPRQSYRKKNHGVVSVGNTHGILDREHVEEEFLDITWVSEYRTQILLEFVRLSRFMYGDECEIGLIQAEDTNDMLVSRRLDSEQYVMAAPLFRGRF